MNVPKFDDHVFVGDTIEWEHDGFTFIAKIEHDDDAGSPDKQDCGFWPSANPKDDGYVGADRLKKPRSLAGHKAWATRVMNAWNNGDWFYCGVVVEVYWRDVLISDTYDHACWGIEANYPQRSSRYRPNDYLGEMVEELALDAWKSLKGKIRSAYRDPENALLSRGGDDAFVAHDWLKAMQAYAQGLCDMESQTKLLEVA